MQVNLVSLPSSLSEQLMMANYTFKVCLEKFKVIKLLYEDKKFSRILMFY